MSDFKNEKTDREWAIEKGIIRQCPQCGKDYDPHIGCTNLKCIQQRKEKEIKELEEIKRLRKELWNKIVWPK
jgi:hypothetical protein